MLQGLSCLHSINVAHRWYFCHQSWQYALINLFRRDIKFNNVMMDPSGMFPDSFHFVKTDLTPDLKRRAQHFTRTQKPPSYYFIDFGLSGYFPSRPTLEPFILPGDKSVPEHQRFLKARNMRAKSETGAPPPELQPRDTVADPFSTDVYLLGNLIHSKFILVSIVFHIPSEYRES
jgi:serine/threonine protein kinase